ncbi:hypothetical protein N7519_003352 [Penicillium mononematosum]|uniref:uncharacterized protein n=1 Tax=Penicillium mononematosum TaxID=268346 RepID=UPI002548FB56|nr:uncharacterized protein N7519_003352 [Penicillium mononematosum]KAJ6188444.1 hypothetical protein N7519_003352 [Penicillium mononematosum]
MASSTAVSDRAPPKTIPTRRRIPVPRTLMLKLEGMARRSPCVHSSCFYISVTSSSEVVPARQTGAITADEEEAIHENVEPRSRAPSSNCDDTSGGADKTLCYWAKRAQVALWARAMNEKKATRILLTHMMSMPLLREPTLQNNSKNSFLIFRIFRTTPWYPRLSTGS